MKRGVCIIQCRNTTDVRVLGVFPPRRSGLLSGETSQQTNKEAAYSVFVLDAARLSDFSIYIRTHNNTLHKHNRLNKLGGLIEGSNRGLRIYKRTQSSPLTHMILMRKRMLTKRTTIAGVM